MEFLCKLRMWVVIALLIASSSQHRIGAAPTLSSSIAPKKALDDLSEYYKAVLAPRIPNCDNTTTPSALPYANKVNTEAKVLTCTMFRDEEGFLSEFVSFYRVLGVHHMLLFDHFSIDNSTAEIKPWVEAGFVTVQSAQVLLDNNIEINNKTSTYWRVMALKKRQERMCMQWGLTHGYKYHITVDIDEYLFPIDETVSLPDAIDEWFHSFPKLSVMYISKYNFNPSPHLLEPIDLLTIEAYQTRYPNLGAVNYYMTVQPKVIYKLNGTDYSNSTIAYLTNCCGFHGCEPRKRHHTYDDVDCKQLLETEGPRFSYHKGSRTFTKSSPDQRLRINHYARSIEKFALKQRTWETASQDSQNSYDVMSYMHRTYGWTHDDTAAMRYSCAVRKELTQTITGDANVKGHYLRPGGDWLRNPEFGRVISDPRKRGRGNGRLHVHPPSNPHRYHHASKQLESIRQQQ